VIDKISRYADRIFYVNPDLAVSLPESAEFLPYAHVDLRDWQPLRSGDGKGTPVVVHAPFRRGVKGSEYVIEAVRRLQQEGVPIEFVLLEGKTREEARRIFERADLLVDQLILGWYGGIAVELMALGKPVVAFDLQEVRDTAREAAVYVRSNDPSDFGNRIIGLLDSPQDRKEMGEQGIKRFNEVLAWEHQLVSLLEAYDRLQRLR
jgi:glycosyltransferase involved in cell wall biosynthesis